MVFTGVFKYTIKIYIINTAFFADKTGYLSIVIIAKKYLMLLEGLLKSFFATFPALDRMGGG